MRQMQIELRALSPLAIRADHAPGGSATSRVIPGSTLIGCLASVHRLLYGERTEEFEALFLQGKVIYPYLYPATLKIGDWSNQEKKDAAELQDATLPIYPLPKTALSCKKHSGFLFPYTVEEPGHGVSDSLFDWAVFTLLSKKEENEPEADKEAKDLKALKSWGEKRYCKRCEKSIEPFKGQYRHNGKIYMRADVDTRLQTRTGINREWGIVEEGILYSREVIEDGMRFWGTIHLPDELVRTFEHFLEEAEEFGKDVREGRRRGGSLFRIGTGRTRGLGAVSIANQEEGEASFHEFKVKLERFDKALRQRLVDAGVQDIRPGYFALTLHAPLLLRDEFLRYRGVINSEVLEEEIGLPQNTFEGICHIACTERVTGWQDLWGMPRTNEYAISTGSTFLFGTTSPVNNDELLKALFAIETSGLGQRRVEGFGRVMVSDPFHTVEEER